MHFFANANIKQKYKVFYCHYKKMKSTTGNNNCWYQSCLYHIKYLIILLLDYFYFFTF